jgi:hypothetical protein
VAFGRPILHRREKRHVVVIDDRVRLGALDVDGDNDAGAVLDAA